MSAEQAQKLVQGGIKAARSGDKKLARKAFTQALKLDPNNEAAWLGMATVSETVEDQVRILRKVLEINPANERAIEALRRLGMLDDDSQPDAEPPIDDAADSAAASPFGDFDDEAEIPASSPFSDFDDDVPAGSPFSGSVDDLGTPPLPGDVAGDLDDLGMPPLPGEIPTADGLDDLGMPPLPGEVPPAASTPSSGGSGKIRSLRTDIEPEDKDDSQREAAADLEAAFAQAPQPPETGQAGLPFVNQSRIARISAEAMADVQFYLDEALADYVVPETEWTKKQRGRAGETEYPIFLSQVAAGAFVFLVIVGFGLWQFISTNATAQRVLFGPSPFPTNTPTVTPTSTPGFTNTPSQTPIVSPTPSPEMLPTVTPGNNDPNFPPSATPIYYPNPLVGSQGLNQAVSLMERGRLDAALPILLEEVNAVELSGDFPPIYHLSDWYLRSNDIESARTVLDEWQEEWENNNVSLFDNSLPLFLVAQARVDIAEAQQAINIGQGGLATPLLETAEQRLRRVLGLGEEFTFVLDANNSVTYTLLADRFAVAGEVDDALAVLDDALANTEADLSLYGNAEIRMEKVRILREAERYDAALREVRYILDLYPFLEEALIQQAELALLTDQPGLAVLFSQQYLLYYPGSVRGYLLLGQAREAENKTELALNAYSRGLGGDESDPFYLDLLTNRANVYLQLGLTDEASDDFTTALELGGTSPAFRARRLQAAFASGDDATVITDAEALLGSGAIPDAQILLLRGRAYARQGEDLRAALDDLNRAITLGLPGSDRAEAQEIVAAINVELNDLDAALAAIDDALDAADTGSRRFLRAQILETQARRTGDIDTFLAALIDYEFVLTWGQGYDFPFFAEAQEAYDSIITGVLGRR